MTSGLSYQEVLKIEGLKNLDSTAHITVLRGVQKYYFTVIG